MRTLHDGSDGHRERLAAILALIDARTRALAGEPRNTIAHDPAPGTNRTLWPQYRFQMCARRIVVMEDRVAKVCPRFACHNRTIPVFLSSLAVVAWYVNLIIPT